MNMGAMPYLLLQRQTCSTLVNSAVIDQKLIMENYNVLYFTFKTCLNKGINILEKLTSLLHI